MLADAEVIRKQGAPFSLSANEKGSQSVCCNVPYVPHNNWFCLSRYHSTVLATAKLQAI